MAFVIVRQLGKQGQALGFLEGAYHGENTGLTRLCPQCSEAPIATHSCWPCRPDMLQLQLGLWL